MSYRPRSPVEATQWIKNGDHPWDAIGEPLADGSGPRKEGRVVRYYRHPFIRGSRICEACGETMHEHGWIDAGGDGITVCPCDYVIDMPGGEEHVVMKPTQFAATYEEV